MKTYTHWFRQPNENSRSGSKNCVNILQSPSKNCIIKRDSRGQCFFKERTSIGDPRFLAWMTDSVAVIAERSCLIVARGQCFFKKRTSIWIPESWLG